ncbi:hypothetical protein [Mycobacterium sp.]|uniref:hypothetical protein n=1 Tax=Mycobacterium sp. TaxID=1785 RepID=UPI002B7706A7|nr:hypothetical protein [Mycobacterium sp.]HTY35089.1 hypothetical protein [Mycobacterium sp.]
MRNVRAIGTSVDECNTMDNTIVTATKLNNNSAPPEPRSGESFTPGQRSAQERQRQSAGTNHDDRQRRE